MCTDSVPVTNELRERLRIFDNGNYQWSESGILSVYPDWRWSKALAWKIAREKQHRTQPAVYEAVGLEPPQQDNVYIPPDVMRRYLATCGPQQLSSALAMVLEYVDIGICHVDGCDEPYPCIPPNRKYCKKHSWATPEGRRYQRRQRS